MAMLKAVVGIGSNIRALRKAAGYDQGDFAQVIGVSQSQMSDWENATESVPELPNLLKIAKGLKTSVNEIIKGFDLEYDVIFFAGHGQFGPEEEIRKSSITDIQKSPETDTLNAHLDPLQSRTVLAHGVPSSAFHAIRQPRGAFSDPGASAERLNVVVLELKDTTIDLKEAIGNLEALAKTVVEALARRDDGGEDSAARDQPSKGPRHRK